MLDGCSTTGASTRDASPAQEQVADRAGFISRPMTIVLIVWGFMFLGLVFVLAYD